MKRRATDPARLRRLVPGLCLVGCLVGLALLLSAAAPLASPLIVAMALGVAAGPLARRAGRTAAGVSLAARQLLRVGVALLGLRVSLHQVADVGMPGLLVAAVTVVATLAATFLAGRRLRVDPKLTLLIAAGSSICGASAVAAMNSVARAREELVGQAIATVTIFGTVAMLAIPLLAPALGLNAEQAGIWAGASIHEVAQVTAAGSAISLAALNVATFVKLARVILLAPVIAVVAFSFGREYRNAGDSAVPGFVWAFLALAAVRTVLEVPETMVAAATIASTTLLTAAMAALGLQVRAAALRAGGVRPWLLGLISCLVAALVALVAIAALGAGR